MIENAPSLLGIWPHALAPAVFLFFFTLPPFPLRRLTFLMSFVSLFYFAFASFTIPLRWSAIRVGMPLLWMLYLGWLAKMILHNPEHDFWRVGRPAHEAEGMGFGKNKLLWALALLTSPRGVGWNFQLKMLRPRQKLVGNWRFAMWQILRAGCCISVGQVVEGLIEKQYATAPGWFSKALIVPGIAVRLWADTEAQYACLNAAFLTLGLTKEQDCLPPFGANIFSLDSLQEFWGQFWHQTHRIMFQDCGRAMVWSMGIRPYSQLSKIVQIWTAFAISGVVHGFAISIGLGVGDASNRFWAVFIFFMLQAVGVTIEELFLLTPGRDLTLYEIGLEDEMIMGRIWTFGWLLFSGFWAMDSWFQTSWMPLSSLTALTILLRRPWRPDRT